MSENLFILQSDSTMKGHDQRLSIKHCCRLNCRYHSFPVCVINNWNKLPQNVVDSSSINMFKSSLNNIEWTTNKFFS